MFRLACFAVLVTFIQAGVCLAGPSAEAEEFIRRGGELRRKGEDARALPLYQRAYELATTPRTAAQLGLVETQLGYRLEAESHLQEALAARNDLWVNKYRSVLETTLRQVQSGIGEVLVVGSPIGAEVSINGRVRGRLPLEGPVRVVAGTIKIDLHAVGFIDASATVAIHGQGQERVSLTLSRIDLPQQSGVPSIASSSTSPRRQSERDTESPRSGLRIAAWSTAAGAVLFLAGGAVETAVASSKLDEFGRTAAADAVRSCGIDQSNYGGAACATIHQQWSRAHTLGLVGVIGGGLLAGTAAALFVLSSDSARSGSAVALRCAPVLPAGMVCSSRF